MVWMFSASVVHVQPCGGLRKLYSRVTAVVNHAYYENRDTSGHLGLELVMYGLRRTGYGLRMVVQRGLVACS